MNIRIIFVSPMEESSNRKLLPYTENKLQVYLRPKYKAHFKIQKTIFISLRLGKLIKEDMKNKNYECLINSN